MEGDESNESEVNEVVISIHSLRMEGDLCKLVCG